MISETDYIKKYLWNCVEACENHIYPEKSDDANGHYVCYQKFENSDGSIELVITIDDGISPVVPLQKFNIKEYCSTTKLSDKTQLLYDILDEFDGELYCSNQATFACEDENEADNIFRTYTAKIGTEDEVYYMKVDSCYSRSMNLVQRALTHVPKGSMTEEEHSKAVFEFLCENNFEF